MNAPRTRVQRRPVHGVLLLDKPIQLSSNQALQKAKWLLRAEKAGHTGTLDPLATGVLPLCFGAATKFSQMHLDADKTYETVLALGVTTTTGDREGDVIEKKQLACNLSDVIQTLQQFKGAISQTPPMYSALKHEGKPLYEYARQGIELERESRQVVIHQLELLSHELGSDLPSIKLRVHCSKGTYIRTLGEDIGRALGCGAHLRELRRVATGWFNQQQCISLQQLEAMPESERLMALQPVECLLTGRQGFSDIVLNSHEAGRFLSGLRRRGNWPDAEMVSVWGSEPRALLGTGHVRAGELIPMRLRSPSELQQSLENFAG